MRNTERGEAEVLAMVGLGLAALLCYGGYKAYEEWRHSPTSALEKCSAERLVAQVEATSLRGRVAELEGQLDRSEYELQTSFYATGRETTLDTFHGSSARSVCEAAADGWNNRDTSAQHWYFCRAARPR